MRFVHERYLNYTDWRAAYHRDGGGGAMRESLNITTTPTEVITLAHRGVTSAASRLLLI